VYMPIGRDGLVEIGAFGWGCLTFMVPGRVSK
jgi:hypothetical protein